MQAISSKWYKSVSPLDARSSGCEQWVFIKILQTLERKKNNNIEGEEEAGQRMVQWEDNSQNRTFVVVCLGNHSRNSSFFYVSSLKNVFIFALQQRQQRESEPALKHSSKSTVLTMITPYYSCSFVYFLQLCAVAVPQPMRFYRCVVIAS